MIHRHAHGGGYVLKGVAVLRVCQAGALRLAVICHKHGVRESVLNALHLLPRDGSPAQYADPYALHIVVGKRRVIDHGEIACGYAA